MISVLSQVSDRSRVFDLSGTETSQDAACRFHRGAVSNFGSGTGSSDFPGCGTGKDATSHCCIDSCSWERQVRCSWAGSGWLSGTGLQQYLCHCSLARESPHTIRVYPQGEDRLMTENLQPHSCAAPMLDRKAVQAHSSASRLVMSSAAAMSPIEHTCCLCYLCFKQVAYECWGIVFVSRVWTAWSTRST